ncbi:MAG: serine hydrolase domain-containing protein [Candidatus Sericytochromatia bacterium]
MLHTLISLAIILAATAPAVPAAPPGTGLPAFDDHASAAGFLPRAKAEEVGVSPARLTQLMAEAQASRASAAIVLKDGRVIAERYFDGPARPLATMSVTKAIVGLAIGMLLDERKIPSVDAPMSTWLPEWKDDARKARVTVRHVMTHSSGVGHFLTGPEIYKHPDWVAFARALPAEHEPGRQIAYNNAVTQLLTEVVRQAAGMPVDRYLDERLFKPLGIHTWRWNRDRAGNPEGFAGLTLLPRDLARIGAMLADGGRWQGRQIVSAAYLEAATTPIAPGGDIGLSWSLAAPRAYVMQTASGLEVLRQKGLGSLADGLSPLTGRRFRTWSDYMEAAEPLIGQNGVTVLRPLPFRGVHWLDEHVGGRVFYHTGWLGQLLLVDPATRVVAVVMRAQPATEAEWKVPGEGFNNFRRGAMTLAAPDAADGAGLTP